MNASSNEITAAVLALSSEAKAELLDLVAASLATNVEPRIKQLQLAEIRRRRADVLSGRVQGVSSQQVRDEIAALLK